MITAVFNLVIRGFGLSARFLLAIYLAKFLDVNAVGSFGLIAGFVAIGPAVLGLGINYVLNREIVGQNIVQSARRIRDRLVISSIVSAAFSLIVFTVLFGTSHADLLNTVLCGIIFCLEGIAFDYHMSLIALGKAPLANVLQFLRSAVWIFPYILLGFHFAQLRSLNFLFVCWLFGLLINYVVTWYTIRHWPWAEIQKLPFDGKWFTAQLQSSSFVYVSDLAIVIIQYVDRFVVAALLGIEATGIFVFFWSFANAVQLLLSTSIIQPTTPRLIELGRGVNLVDWKKQIFSSVGQVLVTGFVLSATVYVAVWQLLPFIARHELKGYLFFFAQLLLAAMIRSIAEVVASGLYSLQLDSSFAWSNLIGAIAGLSFTLIGICLAGLEGVGLAAIGASSLLCLIRFSFAIDGLNRRSRRQKASSCQQQIQK